MAVDKSLALRWAGVNQSRPRLDPTIREIQAQVDDAGNCVITVQGHGTVVVRADHCVLLGRFLLETWSAADGG